MTRDEWLANHPYLDGLADLRNVVEATTVEVSLPTASIPTWSGYTDDFHVGVPFLLSSKFEIDILPVERAFSKFLLKLASKKLPENIGYKISDLICDLQTDPTFPHRAIAWLLDKDALPPKHAGLVQYLGWTLMAKYLHELVNAFSEWREEEKWLRNYCPTCAASPAMGQLLASDAGRLRLLSCGHCGTRWRFHRTGCPFCETQDYQQLAVLAVEGEGYLRIDYCDACSGYLKTYDGEGSEGVFLADWTSLHLDIIARDHGLARYAESLYQL